MDDHIFYIIYLFSDYIFHFFSYFVPFIYVDTWIYTYTDINENLSSVPAGPHIAYVFSIGFIDDYILYIVNFISMY